MTHTIKLYDYEVLNKDDPMDEGHKDKKEFIIQAFGMNEGGKTYCLYIKNMLPFFYVKVSDSWTENTKENFLTHIREEIGAYYENSIVECNFVKRKTLYGFDKGKKYKFLEFKFKNIGVFYKVKGLWFSYVENEHGERVKKMNNVTFAGTKTKIYESNIPPLLRFFHIKNISPSGWISFDSKFARKASKKTTCDCEYEINLDHIKSLPKKEDAIPLKICSFDIEASSSHGDFPVPVKNYKKLADNLLEYWDYHNLHEEEKTEILEAHFKRVIYCAFLQEEQVEFIDQVFPKNRSKLEKDGKAYLDKRIQVCLNTPIKDLNKSMTKEQRENQKVSDWCRNVQEQQYNENEEASYGFKSYVRNKVTILDLIGDKKFKREDKVTEITKTLDIVFPPLEGDKVTFIGSTFWKYGESEPYLNHCIVLGESCPIPNVEIENTPTEKNVLLEWTKIIQIENPDIIIGYNIFGFDYMFMFNRAKELGILPQFLMLSKNKGEVCGKTRDGICKLQESTLKIASGTHELKYINMTGRINLDLYNYFRREYNLDSYKLDFVASSFIGDKIKSYEHIENGKSSIISKNLKGLIEGSFIKFEEIGHTSDSYNDGEKFKVISIDRENSKIIVNGQPVLNREKTLKWGLAKDDVTPQDIFRLTETGKTEDKGIVAKYCVQDCNLVHYLMNKIDILTGFVEMSNICSVPINFLVMRGQGIKLYSFLSKRCRELGTLMPDLNKKKDDDGYEGATVLIPKTDLYLDEPVACVDYSSLYPSSIISENLSHDSKVWTKEYDLNNELIKKTGDETYDNLESEGYKYVDVKYDTYQWKKKDPEKVKSAMVKVKVGYKVCRYAQFPNGEKAIIPSILEELLAARKATRKMAKHKTVTTKDGTSYSGLLTKNENETVVEDKDKQKHTISNDDIVEVKDTYDDFMKNIFDKRQLGYKITANSTYGQCGAKTSDFYEKDVAASTTAVGRMLLTYGQRIIEEVYGDKICETSYGVVHSHAEYVYGDSVTPDTPLLLKHKKTGNIEFKQIDELNNEWKQYEGFKVGESNRREKQQASVNDYMIYTSGGWSNINRVIRHKTKKQIYRVTTHTGSVDVTEDHSLLDENKNKLKPKDVSVGTKLLHNYPTFEKVNGKLNLQDIMNYCNHEITLKSKEEKEAYLKGFFYGDGSCGRYKTRYGVKYSWALNNNDIERCVMLQSICEEVYDVDFKIDDTIKSSGVYKIRPNCGNTKQFVEKYSDFYNKDNYKIIPTNIINASYDLRLAFFCGYYLADGSKCKNENTKNIRMCNKGKIGTSMLYYLATSIGFNVSINTRTDKKDIYRLTATFGKQRKDKTAIKKIDKLGYNDEDEFVYDIETTDGTFNCGFPLIVKNTDSVFMSFKLTDLEGKPIRGKQALKITIELAKEAGELATKFLKKPHDLEYEKTFLPFCLLSKKRYVGMLYEEDPDKCYRKSMGIVLKRRDNAPIVKDIYGGVIDILMEPIKDGETEQDKIKKAMDFTRDFLQDMVDEKFPTSKLIITKSLRSFYKNPQSIAHKVLADRMGLRDPGNKPGPGDRIPFMYIQTKGKVKLQGDKIEHPDYIKENNLKPDYTFYITNQIMKPLLQVFALVLYKMPEFKRKKRAFENKLEVLKQTLSPEKYEEKVIKLKNAEVEKILFENVLRQVKNKKEGNKSIMSFFK